MTISEYSLSMRVSAFRLGRWFGRKRRNAITMAPVLIVGALASAFLGTAAEPPTPEDRVVTVCLSGGPSATIRTPAKSMATKMFAAVGVTLHWREGLSHCPPQSILLSLTDETPVDLLPGALGCSWPYEGSHIRLFYDRIAENRSPVLVPHLLAHVMVHEITHLLEGVREHSEQGIMKATWNGRDFSFMAYKTLPFLDRDVDMIYRGLAARAARAGAGAGQSLSAKLSRPK